MTLDIRAIVSVNRKTLDKIRAEEILQGHHDTGALDSSFEGREFLETDVLVLEGYAIAYIEELEERQEPSEISMSGQDFRNLVAWVERKISRDGAVEIAAAIVNQWETQGKPTEGSKAFSQTGERTGAIKKILEEQEEEFFKELDAAIDQVFEPIFDEQKSETI